MALRMLLVGVVACLGLNQATLHGSDEGSRAVPMGSTLGVGLLGALVEIGPIGAECATAPVEAVVVTATEETPEDALVGWPWNGCIGGTESVAMVEATEMSCTDGAKESAGYSQICAVEEVVEATPEEVIVVDTVVEADPDAAFLVAVDSILDEFLMDRTVVEEAILPPPAVEAELIEVVREPEAVSTTLVSPSMPEPLYPGLAYELNELNDGIGEAPAPAVVAVETAAEERVEGEGRTSEVATAVRLTGQALVAWGRILVQTGPVRR